MKKTILSIFAVTMLAFALTACGKDKPQNSAEASKPDVTEAVTTSPDGLPVDVTYTQEQYAETEVTEIDVKVTTTEETTTVPETTTEADPTSAPKGGGGKSSGGKSGGGSSKPKYNPDADNTDTEIHKFYIGNSNRDGYVFGDESMDTVDEFVALAGLTPIEGEYAQYAGSFGIWGFFERDGFNGKGYWTDGENSTKCYIESDENGYITAIVFADLARKGWITMETGEGKERLSFLNAQGFTKIINVFGNQFDTYYDGEGISYCDGIYRTTFAQGMDDENDESTVRIKFIMISYNDRQAQGNATEETKAQ